MNKSDHQAFRLFSQTHSPAITAVFIELYHWGTIAWAGHAVGDWFYKSAKQISEDLGIALKTAKRAFAIIRKGLCPAFKSEVRMKGNYAVTWFKVVKKEEELSTKYQGQKDPSVIFYEDQNDPIPGSKRPRHNHINAYKQQYVYTRRARDS